MGGIFSGNHFRDRLKKRTVEECLTLDVGQFRDIAPLRPRQTGSIVWSNSETHEQVGSVGFSLLLNGDDDLVLWLNYRVGCGESIELPIRLQTTRPHWGGIRWWLSCPLMNAGQPCRQRVTKLHQYGSYFGCRTCLDLTYRSSQEAHFLERCETRLRNHLRQRSEGIGRR